MHRNRRDGQPQPTPPLPTHPIPPYPPCASPPTPFLLTRPAPPYPPRAALPTQPSRTALPTSAQPSPASSPATLLRPLLSLVRAGPQADRASRAYEQEGQSTHLPCCHTHKIMRLQAESVIPYTKPLSTIIPCP